MNDEELRSQIDALIRDEIQEGINDYIDETKNDTEVSKDEAEKLKVKISNDGVDILIKEYLSLIHICRCRRYYLCRSRWSPYH